MAVQVRESKHPYDNNTNFEVGHSATSIELKTVTVAKITSLFKPLNWPQSCNDKWNSHQTIKLIASYFNNRSIVWLL